MKFMILPCSIRSDTIEKSGGFNETPTNGKMFSWRSHFHPTASLIRGFRPSVSDPFGGEEEQTTYLPGTVDGRTVNPEDFYRNMTSIKGPFVHVCGTTPRKWHSPTFTERWCNYKRRRISNMQHSSRRSFKYCLCFPSRRSFSSRT